MRRSHLMLTLPSQPGTTAERIALFGPQRLAILCIHDQAIVETLVEWQAAVHVRAVGAFDHHPFRFGLEADLVEQGDSLTPVHSAQPIIPWVNCSELSCAPRHSMPPLAGHSMKWMRDIAENRMMSSIVKASAGARPVRE